MISLARKLAWYCPFGGQKILYIFLENKWYPYTELPELCVPDYQMPGTSKGYATFQKLLGEGFIVVPSELV